MKNILIKDKENFEKKLRKIKEDGKANLHVIADFDKTLTKAIVKGQRTHSAMAQIRGGGYLTKDYAPRSMAISAHQLIMLIWAKKLKKPKLLWMLALMRSWIYPQAAI